MKQTPPQPRPWPERLFISSDEPRLRAGWRLLGQFILLVLSIAILGLLSNALLSLLNDISVGGLLLLTILISCLGITTSVFIARRYLDRRTFISLGVSINNQAIYDLIIGFALSGLMIGLIYLLEWAAGWIQIAGLAWRVEEWGSLIASILIMLVVFGLVSWQEELISRGYWLQNLNEGLNLSLGVLLSSAIFALAHAANPNLSWQALLGLFLSGLLFAFGYLRTHQLWLPIGIHLGWNFFEGTVFGFPVSGQYFYQIIRQTVSGPDIITGGAFGPEGGLILLPALFFGAVGVFLYTRNRTQTHKEAIADS